MHHHLLEHLPLLLGMLIPAPVQTTYAQYLPVAQNGMPATTTGWDVDTRIFEDESVGQTGLGFGLAVCQGANDRGCRLGLLSGRNFVGISRADPTLPNIAAGFTDIYMNGENVNVHVRGDLWVIVGNAVTADAQVYVNSVTGQLGVSGISNGTLISNARWQSSAASAGLAIVRLGFIAGV